MNKARITIRIDDDLLDWFRAQVEASGGGNYQTLMNRALREFVKHHEEPLADSLRRVLREEMPALVTSSSGIATMQPAMPGVHRPPG